MDTSIQGVVFDIQRMCIHDGPGIRTTVFLKGCPLRCIWCHNPEGQRTQPELAYTAGLCIHCGYCATRCPEHAHWIDNETGHHFLRDACQACFICTERCYSGALERVGRVMSAEEVALAAARDEPFYRESNGGVTLSGGEPLAQYRFAHAILAACKAKGLHICLETSGDIPRDHLAAVAPYVDIFLYDYKETDPGKHRLYTGADNRRVLDNLILLNDLNASIILRCPIVPGLNDREDHLLGIAQTSLMLRNRLETHILPFHRLGTAKAGRFGYISQDDACELPDRDMTPMEAESIVSHLRGLGVTDVMVP